MSMNGPGGDQNGTMSESLEESLNKIFDDDEDIEASSETVSEDLNVSADVVESATDSEEAGAADGDAQLPVQFKAGPGQGGALRVYGKNLKAFSDDEEDRDIRKKGRMGDKMVELGLITEDQLNVALQEKKISGKMLGEIFVELGFITIVYLVAYI